MNPTRRAISTALAGLALPAAWRSLAQTPSPGKPMRVVQPLAPRDGSDFMAAISPNTPNRRVAQSVIVENRPGAGGMLGMEDFGAVPNAVSSAAGTANKAALRAVVARAKAAGGGTLRLPSGNQYYMGTSVGDPMDSMAIIDFEGFTILAEKNARFTLAANNAVSYFFYITRGKFRAEGVRLEGADSATIDAFAHIGSRLFCIADDDSLGLSGFSITNCSAYGCGTLAIAFPKNGSGIRKIYGRGNYAEECSYGFCTSASTPGSGPVEDIDFEIAGKNVYRLAFGFGYGQNVRIVARQVAGHKRSALGNGTVVNWSIPKVSGWMWKNVHISCQSDEDWARGVLLSIQTDAADIAAGGAKYPNRGFDGVEVDVLCSKGKYSGSSSNDFAFYIGHISTDTGHPTMAALATTWKNMNVRVESPADLALGRYPAFTGCVTTRMQTGNSLVTSAKLDSPTHSAGLEQLSNLFGHVCSQGRPLGTRRSEPRKGTPSC